MKFLNYIKDKQTKILPVKWRFFEANSFALLRLTYEISFTDKAKKDIKTFRKSELFAL